MTHILTEATFGVAMDGAGSLKLEGFSGGVGVNPCWLHPSDPLFWLWLGVAEGGRIGRSDNNGFVIKFVMRLQRPTNKKLIE